MTPTNDAPVTVEREAIERAIKATEYKYFGDYEMSDDQREAVDVLVEAARHRLAALASAPACAASPDHSDIMETIANAADDWQKQGYPTALAEVRDMANVGRSLLERIADHSSEGPLKGWRPADCPTEVVCDLLNMLADASAPAGDEVDVRKLVSEALGDHDCGNRRGLKDRLITDIAAALARPRAAVGEREA